MQRVLWDQGVLCHSSKGCLSETFACGLARDSPLWIRMIEDRRLTVHTYNESTTVAIYRNLRSMSRSSGVTQGPKERIGIAMTLRAMWQQLRTSNHVLSRT